MERRTFLKAITSLGMVSLFSPAWASEVCKKELHKSAFSLADGFRNPPFSSGVYTWWHWMNGNITKEGITCDLEAMKANGIAGYQMFEAGTGIPVGPVESLSDEWVELVLHALKESERLGLEFAMHNCPGWSSSGGPWITPDKAMQMMTWSEVRLSGGGRIERQLPVPEHLFNHYRDTFCIAVPAGLRIVPKSSVIDLSSRLDRNGVLFWDAPAGEWLVMRFGQTAKNKSNHSAPTKATGLDCDKFSTEALDYHLEHMFKRLMPMMKKVARYSKVGLLIDSYEMGDQDWTYDMPDYFQKKRGYPLWCFLPVFTGKIIENEEMTERFRFDFRRTQADMIAERYYAHFQKRCRENGIISYTEPYGGQMMEELQVAQCLDVNMGEFWCGQTVLWANYKYNRTVKQVASIAHALGRNIVGAEAFTAEPDADKWLMYPYALKSLGDYMFTRGLTRIYFHRYVHQPNTKVAPGMTMGPWGLHFDRTNTWWKPGKAWIDYLNRCQYVFQHSVFLADILYHSGDGAFGETIEPEKTLLAPPDGYDYDMVNSELLAKAHVRNGKLFFPGTRSDGYKLLVLLKSETMSLSTLELLTQLVEDGVSVIGKKPQRSLGLLDGENEDRFMELANRVWQSPNVYEEESVREVLDKMSVSPDFVYHSSKGSPAVHYIHYQHEDADIYFVANRKRLCESGVAHFRVKDVVPELWNPYTAEIIACPVYRNTDEGVEIPLDFAPAGSMFIVFRKVETARQAWTDAKFDGVSLFFLPTVSLPSVQSNFSITCWIKPETDIAMTEDRELGDMRARFFAIYPLSGWLRYGEGHSVVGLSVGRNGVVVYEHAKRNKAVLRYPASLAGWTHLALVYKDNAPSIWLNGVLVSEGKVSGDVVHCVIDNSDLLSKADTYEGGLCDFRIHSRTLGNTEIESLFGTGLPRPEYTGKSALSWLPRNKFIAWKMGTYEFCGGKTTVQKIVDELPAPIAMDGPWKVSFPVGAGAPERIVLERLHSLRMEQDFGVRHFSGTMSYFYSLSIGPAYVRDGICLRLDLGRVEVLAQVMVNGKLAATCWAPPYSADVQGLLHEGTNEIEVRVTNLWVNRLIGDEYLPEENSYSYQTPTTKYIEAQNGGIEKLPAWYMTGDPKPAGGRIAFATWKHYERTSPLVESGLLGPVTLIPGWVCRIPDRDE